MSKATAVVLPRTIAAAVPAGPVQAAVAAYEACVQVEAAAQLDFRRAQLEVRQARAACSAAHTHLLTALATHGSAARAQDL